MLLAADIGGTKTILALFSDEKGPHQPIEENRYSSVDYDSLGTIVADFLQGTGVQPDIAAFGVAGPVRAGKVQVTNLPWIVDAAILVEALNGATVHLLNDLEAIAYSIPTLRADDLASIKAGKRDEKGPIAVIAPGTGLGEAFLFWDGHRYRPIPSEGGHTDFAPATALELDLLAYLHTKMNHVSYERVCSGLGIPNLYDFLRSCEKFPEPVWLAAEMAQTADKTPVIMRAALEATADIAVGTLNLFLGILGSEAGNLVLQSLATGGVYLAGGIPPRIIPQLRTDTFLDAFTRKGRFANMLIQVPVDVIVNPRAGLYGAANHGFLALAGDI